MAFTRKRTEDDPTPGNPGLRIVAPSSARDARHFYPRQTTPFASYACGCGATGDATGPRDVMTLQQQYADHKSDCDGRSNS